VRPALSVLWVVLSAATGCEASHATSAPLPTASSCSSAWRSVSPPESALGSDPQTLRWQDGNLYYDQGAYVDHDVVSPKRIMSIRDTGGSATEIVQDAGWGLWVEGDQVLYARGDQLFSAPITGGVATLVADGQTFELQQLIDQHQSITNAALDESDLYFELRTDDAAASSWSVWHTPRAGGVSQQIGEVPKALGPLHDLAVRSDDLLLASYERAFIMSKTDGATRELRGNAGSSFFAAGSTDVLWSVVHLDPAGVKRPTETLLRSKLPSGKAEPFWPSKSETMRVSRAWSDEQDNWVIAGDEEFSDGKSHLSIWSIDRHGHATRRACDPIAGAPYITTAAFSPDAAYFVVSHASTGDDAGAIGAWMIVSTAR
jgi:hypothetical protein